jgi:hypothetical protein
MSDDADVMTDIEILKAVEEIRRVEARYARYADEKRWADLAGLFTVDGTFTPLDASGKPPPAQLRSTCCSRRRSRSCPQPLHTGSGRWPT